MSTVTSRRAPPAKKLLLKRAELCQELVKIERKLAPDYARIEAIGVQLKQLAADLGASFKEDFVGLGSVAVAPPAAAEFKGDVPQIQTEIWQGMKPAEQKALVKTGIVKIVPQWSKASNGRVTVKVA